MAIRFYFISNSEHHCNKTVRYTPRIIKCDIFSEEDLRKCKVTTNPYILYNYKFNRYTTYARLNFTKRFNETRKRVGGTFLVYFIYEDFLLFSITRFFLLGLRFNTVKVQTAHSPRLMVSFLKHSVNNFQVATVLEAIKSYSALFVSIIMLTTADYLLYKPNIVFVIVWSCLSYFYMTNSPTLSQIRVSI